MINNLDKCIDPRGKDYIVNVMDDLAQIFECSNYIEAINKLKNIIAKLNLDIPAITEDELSILTNSVNEQRLNNNPIKLDKENISKIYSKALKRK